MGQVQQRSRTHDWLKWGVLSLTLYLASFGIMMAVDHFQFLTRCDSMLYKVYFPIVWSCSQLIDEE